MYFRCWCFWILKSKTLKYFEMTIHIVRLLHLASFSHAYKYRLFSLWMSLHINKNHAFISSIINLIMNIPSLVEVHSSECIFHYVNHIRTYLNLFDVLLFFLLLVYLCDLHMLISRFVLRVFFVSLFEVHSNPIPIFIFLSPTSSRLFHIEMFAWNALRIQARNKTTFYIYI